MINRVIVKGYRLFDALDMSPQAGMNIIVGDNAAGKSTLLEAITLGLTGRVGGRWAGDELNPYWFNLADVTAFFEARRRNDGSVPAPEILIELYLACTDAPVQALRGVHNSLDLDSPGLKMCIRPAAEYAAEFEAYVSDPSCPSIVPVEYYEVDWRDFTDERLVRRPKHLAIAAIDSRTIRSSAGVDYHTRTMMSAYIEDAERAAIAVAHRTARHALSADDGALAAVNLRMAQDASELYDDEIGLHMDQSAKASWEADLVPHVQKVPFAMAGQGQQAAIKVALAMHRSAESTEFVLIEEPENHMSHTSLTKLVGRIEKLAADRQVFVTTHSSFVLNRLGLDSLTLLHNGHTAAFADLPPDTVRYFQKLSGYDTLRLVLATQAVLVEGPSDEIIFGRAYKDRFGEEPMKRGVDIVSMQGVALRRGLELCKALNRKVAALRDNDGKQPDHWTSRLSDVVEDGVRQVFIGLPEQGKTVEPQLISACGEPLLRSVLPRAAGADLREWMEEHKTEASLSIATSSQVLTYPPYMEAALDFLA